MPEDATMTRTVTADDIRAEFANLDPDTRNPVQGDTCVYTSWDGNHCLAGQVLVNMNLPVPGAYQPDNQHPIYTVFGFNEDDEFTRWGDAAFTAEAVVLLAEAQQLADEFINGKPATWGEVIDRLAMRG